jgi:hypothetical protein
VTAGKLTVSYPYHWSPLQLETVPSPPRSIDQAIAFTLDSFTPVQRSRSPLESIATNCRGLSFAVYSRRGGEVAVSTGGEVVKMMATL